MKINTAKHSVATRLRSQLQGNSSFAHLGLKEIPIAYIDTSNVIRVPKTSVEQSFTESKKQRVRPYTMFYKPEVYLFNDDNSIVKRTLKRLGNNYFYEPANQTEFSPLIFDVYLEVQRQQQYYNDRVYDIKVSAVNTDNTLIFMEQLMTLFGDSYRHDICPSNVRFNSGSTNYMTLLERTQYDSDFIFVKSIDGLHYGNNTDKESEIDIQGILDNHTNIWMFCDNYEGRYHTVTSTETSNLLLHMNKNVLYKNKTVSVTRNQAAVFDQDISFYDSQIAYQYEYLNEAVLVIHKIGKGFIVISPSWFLDNLTETAPIIYEGIMQCYLSGYCKSRTMSTWITEEPVDYKSYSDIKFGRYHNRLTLSDFLADEQHEVNSYKISDIRVTTPYVKYVGMLNNNELLFRKIGEKTDPPKEQNQISVYTTKHTVINYVPEDLFLVETPLNIEFNVSDDSVFITVHPYLSSDKDAYIVEDQTFKIEDLTIPYVLYLGKGSSDVRNLFFLLKTTDTPDSSYLKAADIFFETKQVPTVYDTRVMGGGIPEDQPDDYDMLDIGHVLGRPYRVGSTIIVRLPLKYQNYEKRIAAELDKHIAAGDDYVIVFEKQSQERS